MNLVRIPRNKDDTVTLHPTYDFRDLSDRFSGYELKQAVRETDEILNEESRGGTLG